MEVRTTQHGVHEVVRDVYVSQCLVHDSDVLRITSDDLDVIYPRAISEALRVAGKNSNLMALIEKLGYEPSTNVASNPSNQTAHALSLAGLYPLRHSYGHRGLPW